MKTLITLVSFLFAMNIYAAADLVVTCEVLEGQAQGIELEYQFFVNGEVLMSDGETSFDCEQVDPYMFDDIFTPQAGDKAVFCEAGFFTSASLLAQDGQSQLYMADELTSLNCN